MAALLNKTALVTGASRGIGRATASALAAAGAHVLVHYGHSVRDAESLVADIRSKEGRADAIQADLGTPDGATLLAKDVRSIVGERLDVLVSNAGISKAATISSIIRSKTLTISLQPICAVRFFWCNNSCPSSVRARASLQSRRLGRTA